MFKRFLASVILASWSLAQVPGFDPSWDWNTQSTAHFDLHYPAELADLVPEVAAQAEADYRRLSEIFGSNPGRIQLVLTYGIANPNGFSNPAMDQVVLYTPQQRQADSFSVAGPSWWQTLTLHELVHAFDLSRGGASPGSSDLPINAIKPPPFIEGFAVYQKHRLLGTSRLSTARTRMLIRSMVASKTYPSLNQVMSYYQKEDWPSEGMLAYNFGSWWMRYLGEKHGQEKLIDFIALTDLRLPKFDQAFEEHFDVSLEQSYQDFLAYLEAEFTPEVEALSAGATVPERITTWGYLTSGPALAPDGNLAYIQVTPRQSGLRLRTRTQDRELVSGSGIAFPDFSPDSKKLIFSRIEPYGPYQSSYDLFELELTTGKMRRLVEGENSYLARYTKDGEVIYLRQNPDGTGGVYLLSQDGSQPVWTPAQGSFHGLAPSPDGQYLAVTYRKGPWQDLYLLNSDGTRTRLTQDPAAETDLTWSEDGKYLIFAREAAVSDLYAYRPEDGQFFRVTQMATGAFQPAGASSSSGLVFLGYGPEGYDLYRIPYQPEQWARVVLPHQNEPQFMANQLSAPSHPYQVANYLKPWFWLPGFISSSAAGLLTAGGDPLYQHIYGMGVGWDWSINSPTLLIDYTYQGFPNVPFSLTAWADRTGLALNFMARRPLPLTASASREPRLGTNIELRASEAEDWQVYAGETWNRLRGQEGLHQQIAWGYQGGVGGKNGAQGIFGEAWLQSRWALATPEPSSILARLRAGASNSELFTLGGYPETYPLRGFESQALTGASATSASLGYQFRIAALEQPLLGFPVFLDKLDAEVFLDGGSIDNQVKGSVGAELELSFTLGYLLEGPRLIAGMAQGFGEDAPIGYLRFELAGLSF